MKRNALRYLPQAAKLIGKLGKQLADLLSGKSLVISQPVLDSYWFSYLDGTYGTYNGILVSYFYHPTKAHSATTDGKLGVKKSVARGGDWACSKQTRGLIKNKAYWNVE